MAAALLRALRGMWRQSFGSDFMFWAAGARPKVLRWRHFAVLAVLKKKKITRGPIGGTKTPQTPLFRLYFFAPLCSLGPPDVLFSAGGSTRGGLRHTQPQHTQLGFKNRYRYRLTITLYRGGSTSFERFPGVITSDYQRGSAFCICICEHQTGYRGQCRDWAYIAALYHHAISPFRKA
jgi:hypothetical protein